MAFPTISTQATTATSNTASKAITMPATIVAGRLLMSVVGAWGGSGTGAISGWTPITTWTNNNSCSIGVFGKIAAGSDTGTFTYGSAADISAITYQIAGWSGTLSDIAAAVANQGFTSAYPNPPNLVPAFGAQDYLWFACGIGNGSPTYTAPTNFSGITQVAQGTSTKMGVATRSFNAASQDPAAFTGTATPTIPTGITIAVPPVMATATGKFFPFFGMGHHDEPRDELAGRRRRRHSGLYVPDRRQLTVARAA